MAAYVDGEMDDIDREIFETRLEDDATLRAEVADLTAMRAAMIVAPTTAIAVTKTEAAAPATGAVSDTARATYAAANAGAAAPAAPLVFAPRRVTARAAGTWTRKMGALAAAAGLVGAAGL